MDIERLIKEVQFQPADNGACGYILATKVNKAIEDLSKVVLEQGHKLNVLVLIVRPNLSLYARHRPYHDKKWFNTSIKVNEWTMLSPGSEPACLNIDLLTGVPAYEATRVLPNMDTLDSEDATIAQWLPRRKLKAFLKSYINMLYSQGETSFKHAIRCLNIIGRLNVLQKDRFTACFKLSYEYNSALRRCKYEYVHLTKIKTVTRLNAAIVSKLRTFNAMIPLYVSATDGHKTYYDKTGRTVTLEPDESIRTNLSSALRNPDYAEVIDLQNYVMENACTRISSLKELAIGSVILIRSWNGKSYLVHANKVLGIQESMAGHPICTLLNFKTLIEPDLKSLTIYKLM